MTPYTYIIECKPISKKYYGVRYAKGCKPDDLWKTYFTSSKIVRNLIETYGKESFEIQIDKEFETVEEAIDYEHQFIITNNLSSNPNWLNVHRRKAIDFNDPVISEKLSIARKGRVTSEETKKKLSAIGKGKKLSEETKRKISESSKGKTISQESIDKARESKKKSGKNQGESHWTYGKQRDEETRRKISEALKGKSYNVGYKHEKRVCPHCNLEGAGGNMTRFHFDNCKKRQSGK